jgi:hypothetical protein
MAGNALRPQKVDSLNACISAKHTLIQAGRGTNDEDAASGAGDTIDRVLADGDTIAVGKHRLEACNATWGM